MRCLRQNSPGPDSGQSSPHPRSNPHQAGSHGDNIKSRCQDQTDTVSSLQLKGGAVIQQPRLHVIQLQFSLLFCSCSEVGGSLCQKKWLKIRFVIARQTFLKVTYLVCFALLKMLFFFSPQSVQINKILSNALEWGVKILFVDGTISPFFAAAVTHQLLFMF